MVNPKSHRPVDKAVSHGLCFRTLARKHPFVGTEVILNNEDGAYIIGGLAHVAEIKLYDFVRAHGV